MAGVITSLPPLVEQPPGNNSSNPAGLPGVTYTAAVPVLAQTWTGLQTYTLGSMQFAGSTSGNTFLNATAIASGTLTLPAATDTLVGRNTTDTLTNKTLTAPILTTPNLGVATAATINKYTFTTPATGSTLTILDGKTATFNNSITFSGTDATTLTFQGTDTYIGRATTDTLTNKTYDTGGAGNVFSIAGVAVTANTGTGAIVRATSPAITTPTGIVKGDVGLGNVANVDTTNAANISSGTLLAARLPNPSATTLGGVQSLAAVASKWVNTISTTGVPSATQPAFTDVSGSVAAAQMPALTGDITTTAGTVATTIGANKVTNAMRAQMAAYTLKGNATGATANEADVDITALTAKAAPVSADIVLIQDSAAANAFKRTTVGALASAGSVASFNSLTGAVTSNIVVQVFAASGTYTPTAGMLHAVIECVGGGGGGGGAAGAAGSATAGSGGGAASYSRKFVTAAAVGASQTVTIGAGGGGGAAGANNGSAGGDTSVGILCIGKGGAGGGFANIATGGVGGGGAGGIAGTGDVTAVGNAGGSGSIIPVVSGVGSSVSAPGGGSFFGGAAAGVQTTTGNAGTKGGGGSGGQVNNSALNMGGGAGGAGYIVITEFINL